MSGKKLALMDLRNAKLTRADLARADLRNANLTGADLARADLRSVTGVSAEDWAILEARPKDIVDGQCDPE